MTSSVTFRWQKRLLHTYLGSQRTRCDYGSIAHFCLQIGNRQSAIENLKMIQLTCEQAHALIAHARDAAPNEACGIIGGKENRALKIYPLKNTHATPRVNFYADPLELLAAFRDIEANGWEHLAIYHSHPASDAFPSATDIAQAYYPDVAHLIISLANPEQPIVRAFRIVQGYVQEIALVTKDG